jgi:hypothetical protein
MTSRRTRWRAAFATLAASGVALTIACAGKVTPASGLEVVISSDLRTPQDFDTLSVTLSQETSPGAWRVWLDTNRTVPDEIQLPTTVSVQAGDSNDQEALIVVTAKKGAAPLVQRTVQVQLPKDRVAQLNLVLAARCSNVLSCPDGESCQPETGKCGSNVVESSSLPDFQGDGTNAPPTSGGDGSTIGPDGGSPTMCTADMAAHCQAIGQTCLQGACVGGPPQNDSGTITPCSPSQCGGGCCDMKGGCIPVGGACPQGGTCIGPNQCGGTTGQCGQAGQPCCASGGAGSCGGDSICVNGTCQGCGAANQACCPGNGCFPNGGNQQLMCDGTQHCIACGDPGLPCCSGGGCKPTGMQQIYCGAGDNICHACGGLNQECCNGNGCNGGPPPALMLACNAGTGKCEVQCGQLNGPCCNGSCNGGNLQCTAGTCTSCGHPGEVCCPYNNCFNQMNGHFGCCIGNQCYDEGQNCTAGVGGGVCSQRQCQKSDGGVCGQMQCCPGSVCTNGNSVCVGSNCQGCGNPGSPACPGNYCSPGSNYVSDGGCEQCGALFKACCKSGTACQSPYDCNDAGSCGPPP